MFFIYAIYFSAPINSQKCNIRRQVIIYYFKATLCYFWRSRGWSINSRRNIVLVIMWVVLRLRCADESDGLRRALWSVCLQWCFISANVTDYIKTLPVTKDRRKFPRNMSYGQISSLYPVVGWTYWKQLFSNNVANVCQHNKCY